MTTEHVAPAVVVVTAMPLSDVVRAELSEMLGQGYVVVDIKVAPSTANLVLTPVVSGQLLGSLRAMFPDARILYTELDDDARGISFTGPLARIVARRPDGYFVAHTLDALSPVVQSEARLQLAGSAGPTPLMLSLSAEGSGPVPAAPPPPEHPSTLDPGQAGPRSATVRWVDVAAAPSGGRCLDLDLVDALVAQVTRTGEPRRDPLWPAVAAECVVRLAAEGDDVVVEVGGLPPSTRAELQVRVASEHLDQDPRPQDSVGHEAQQVADAVEP